ncbi:MAG: hypothetical protein WAN36_14615 [Calditrichia bacterium]
MSTENKHNQEQNPEYWRKQVEELKMDSVHGSGFLANQALDIIEEFINRRIYRNRTELLQSLSKLTNALVRGKPLMALIYTRAHYLLDYIQEIPKEERDIDKIRQSVLDEIEKLREEDKKNQERISKYGARLLMDQHVVLVHSASSIVEAILLQARRMKKRFRLICTESRPIMEGSELAARMARAGIKTKLIPDADVSRALQEAHFVLTGADRITESSFVNKTGTAAIATISHQLSKPFYVAAQTNKILLKRIYPTRFQSVNENEIFADPPENLTVENFYFEETPLYFVHKMICESGIYEREEFVERYL